MPFTKKRRDKSPSSTPVPTTEDGGAQLPEKEWDAMTKVLNAIYDYRTEDGFDPSKLFHKKVNKRMLPDYYETIKEPMALSTIKQKIHARAYGSFADYVRDFALIPHNAMIFNMPKSGAFQDALVIKEQLEKNLQELVEEGVIDKASAALPDLGEIPAYEDIPEDDAEEEEEDSDEDAEEEEDEEDDDGAAPVKRKRGRPSLHKRDTGDDTGAKRARGRPPKLLTPMEARIQAVLKGIRKPKNSRGQHMIRHFERLPDKAAFPDYYVEVKHPMAYDLLKRKVKRKKYISLEAFLNDVNLMFDNAKRYNEDESQIYKDAVSLQVEAGRLYDIEKVKSDAAFVDDEGKMPLPDGILHNGELYKVGDWVHIQNPNDLTKPIPSQIYRTYRSPSGQAMVNVCWYYRPEQTVHRYDKHFYDHEVVKTGRYRDHMVEEIEGRCFIMFTTRYFKGRPRGLAQGTEIYVCEARYNEEKALFNKVKTWTSCLPDEVRDRDYEMDLYDQPKRMKKNPSPIKYLLRDDQKETDDLPKPEWGAEKAPPKIGAVHRRPRTDRDSPPPEPTPPPQANMNPMPSQPSRTVSSGFAAHLQRPQQATFKASFGPTSGMYSQSPAQAPLQRTATMQSNYAPLTPQPNLARAPSQNMNSGYAPTAGMQPTPTSSYPPRPGMASTTSYRDPPPIEVYTLPDAANLSIPAEVREQYRRDEQGRILFFTAPPVVPASDGASLGGHSVRYLAAKARRADALAAERKRKETEDEEKRAATKRQKVQGMLQLSDDIDKLHVKLAGTIEEGLSTAVKRELSADDLTALRGVQNEVMARLQANEQRLREVETSRKVPLASEVFLDDYDTRIT